MENENKLVVRGEVDKTYTHSITKDIKTWVEYRYIKIDTKKGHVEFCKDLYYQDRILFKTGTMPLENFIKICGTYKIL